MSDRSASFPVALASFREAADFIGLHAHRTPLITSRRLSAQSGMDVRLKAELFQRGGSYKIRGPLNKLRLLSPAERTAGVICSSAGNHAQGVALAAQAFGVRAVVVMATNATVSKITATREYGAEVVLHGEIWDEANDKAIELAARHGYTYIHPFDDLELIAGQGTVGLEILEDWPDVEVVVVPIGGGGLISGVSMALKSSKPGIRVIGVEAAGAPGMQHSLLQGSPTTLDRVDTVVDGLRVRRVGEMTVRACAEFVDEIVTVSDQEIWDAVVWLMANTKLVAEGAAAATVAAVLGGRIQARQRTRVACVLSGGNLDLAKLHGLSWN